VRGTSRDAAHTRDAIEAHLTIVFAALAVARYLQGATGMSVKKIVQALRALQQITHTIACQEHTAADPLTEPAREPLKLLLVRWPETAPPPTARLDPDAAPTTRDGPPTSRRARAPTSSKPALVHRRMPMFISRLNSSFRSTSGDSALWSQ